VKLRLVCGRADAAGKWRREGGREVKVEDMYKL
jgi:hypothetical protein